MAEYFLMHKDDICGVIEFDDISWHVIAYKDYGTGLSPYFGHTGLPKIKKWWQMRAVPESRSLIQNARRTGYLNATEYLANNLAISLIDRYWICPKCGTEAHLKYNQVRYSYDYNASLGGQMEKHWNLCFELSTVPDLIKESSRYYGQQSINEVIATKIHELQDTTVPFVKYNAEAIDGIGIITHCNSFVGIEDHIEFIPAYEIIESQIPQDDESLYDHYIDLCVQHGIDRECIQNFMDYQTLTDFIISNTDRHLLNFGVLRDTNTMQLIGPAPIFDSGNSMFYNDDIWNPYSREELLRYPITGFYKTQDKLLSKVKNWHILKSDLLPTSREIKEWYIQAGVPEQKSEFISQNYQIKVEMLKEFQHGEELK